MENFIMGLGALFALVRIEAAVLYYSPMIRGFVIGYVVASLVYGFIVSGERRRSEKKKN